jgi:hypothetical protein
MSYGDKLGNTRPQAGEGDETVCSTFARKAFVSVAQSGLGSGELLAAGSKNHRRFPWRDSRKGWKKPPERRLQPRLAAPQGLGFSWDFAGRFANRQQVWQPAPLRNRFTGRLPFAAILAALALASLGCNRDHKVTVKETVEEAPGKAAVPVVLSMGDPKQEKQLVSGFYGIEANAWRWTARDFTVSLRPPTGSATQGATLDFALSVPQVTIDKLKSVTLSASINGTALAPETYAHEGQYDYKRDIPPNLIQGGAVRVEFHLDKSMPPAGGDARELGIVARSVGLESK